MVQVGDAATSGEKELSKRYPVTSGITAGTTKQEGRKPLLKPEKQNLIPKRYRVRL